MVIARSHGPPTEIALSCDLPIGTAIGTHHHGDGPIPRSSDRDRRTVWGSDHCPPIFLGGERKEPNGTAKRSDQSPLRDRSGGRDPTIAVLRSGDRDSDRGRAGPRDPPSRTTRSSEQDHAIPRAGPRDPPSGTTRSAERDHAIPQRGPTGPAPPFTDVCERRRSHRRPREPLIISSTARGIAHHRARERAISQRPSEPMLSPRFVRL
jgi:hypothetical protein